MMLSTIERFFDSNLVPGIVVMCYSNITEGITHEQNSFFTNNGAYPKI